MSWASFLDQILLKNMFFLGVKLQKQEKREKFPFTAVVGTALNTGGRAPNHGKKRPTLRWADFAPSPPPPYLFERQERCAL